MKFFAALLAMFLITCTDAGAQEWAREKLEKAPRHGEWVNITSGNRSIRAFVVYPEVKHKAAVVVLIHEIFGLSNWIKLTADQLAEQGYIAVAPDLLSGMGRDGGGTESYASEDAVRSAIGKLKEGQITDDVNNTVLYASKLPAANGKVVLAGFCWGGAQAFRMATVNKKLLATYVFYGAAPQGEGAISRISRPVYGYFAENDARVNTTLLPAVEALKKWHKTYTFEYFKGAGHGFMRAGEAPDAAPGNKEARAKCLKMWFDDLSRETARR